MRFVTCSSHLIGDAVDCACGSCDVEPLLESTGQLTAGLRQGGGQYIVEGHLLEVVRVERDGLRGADVDPGSRSRGEAR